jgi:hypothetical protein
MKILDLLAALAEAGTGEALGRRIARSTAGAEPGLLTSTFDLALRSGELPHKQAVLLQRKLHDLVKDNTPEPDEDLPRLREETRRLQEEVAAHRARHQHQPSTRDRIASLDRRRAELTAMAAAARDEIAAIGAQEDRLRPILEEVQP